MFVFYFGSSGTGKKMCPVQTKRVWGGHLEENEGPRSTISLCSIGSRVRVPRWGESKKTGGGGEGEEGIER